MLAKARGACIFYLLASGSLYSVGQLCDGVYEVYFHKDDFRITKDGLFFISGTRTPNSQLWITDDNHSTALNAVFNDAAKEKSKTSFENDHTYSIPTHSANILCPELHLVTRITFYHTALFCPVISTFCKALDNGPSLPSQEN